MSVSATGFPALELYLGGNLDPRLPAGRWFGHVAVTGDASGGIVSMFVEFFPSTAPPNTFCFSLEQVSIARDDGLATDFSCKTRSFTQAIGGLAADRTWTLQGLTGGGAISGSLGRDSGFLPVLLGYRVDGDLCRLELYDDSNTDTRNYNALASGEFWLQEAGLYIGAQQPAGTPAFEASRPPEAQGAMIDIRAGRPPPQSVSPGPRIATPIARVDAALLTGPIEVAQPLRPKKVLASPVAIQDPLASLRAAFASTLAALGMQVATIPGSTRESISANFETMRAQFLSKREGAVLRPGGRQPRGRQAVPIAPVVRLTGRPSAAASRSGSKALTTNSRPTGGQVPNLVAKTAAATSLRGLSASQRALVARVRGRSSVLPYRGITGGVSPF